MALSEFVAATQVASPVMETSPSTTHLTMLKSVLPKRSCWAPELFQIALGLLDRNAGLGFAKTKNDAKSVWDEILPFDFGLVSISSIVFGNSSSPLCRSFSGPLSASLPRLPYSARWWEVYGPSCVLQSDNVP